MKKSCAVFFVSLLCVIQSISASTLSSRIDALVSKFEQQGQYIKKMAQALGATQKRVIQLETYLKSKPRVESGNSGYQQQSEYADPLDASLTRLVSAFAPRNDQEADKFRNTAGRFVGHFENALTSLNPVASGASAGSKYN